MTGVKWDTMQSKRVHLDVTYGGDDAALDELDLIFSRTQKLVQAQFPDVMVEGARLPPGRDDDATTFTMSIDGRVVYEKPRERVGVFLSMRLLEREIARARRARRPTSNYGDDEAYAAALAAAREGGDATLVEYPLES